MSTNDHPFVDSDGAHILNIREASRLLTPIVKQTRQDGANRGSPFRFDSGVRPVWYIHDRHGFLDHTKYHGIRRMMWPSAQVTGLKRIWEDAERKETDPWASAEDTAAEKTLRKHSLMYVLQHGRKPS